MTCIVGIEQPGGRVTLGADSAGSRNGTVIRIATPKVFETHGIGFAMTGSYRFINILQNGFRPPKRAKGMGHNAYMVSLANALRACLAESGAIRKDDDAERTDHAAALIAYRGRLYEMGSDFSLIHTAEGYMAHGSGQEVALGSLHTTAQLGLSARRRAELALAAAAEYVWSVKGPFNVIEVEA